MTITEIVCPIGYADNSEMRMTITEIQCRLAWEDAAIMHLLDEIGKLLASYTRIIEALAGVKK